MVFLELPNVPKGMVFAEKVTYTVPYKLLEEENVGKFGELQDSPKFSFQ